MTMSIQCDKLTLICHLATKACRLLKFVYNNAEKRTHIQKTCPSSINVLPFSVIVSKNTTSLYKYIALYFIKKQHKNKPKEI